MKVDHLEHLEDTIFFGPKKLLPLIIFKGIRVLIGTFSLKWDGAPSIFAGTDPSDGKFFVSSKSIFNKEPIIYKTHQDVLDHCSHDSDLVRKFSAALTILEKSAPDNIIQGDMLWGPGSELEWDASRMKHVFHPNTIRYEADYEDAMYSSIMGIAWHTSYEGEIGNLQKSKNAYNFSLSENPALYSFNADDWANTLPHVDLDIDRDGLNKHAAQILYSFWTKLHNNEVIGTLFLRWCNHLVRNPNHKWPHIFVAWVNDKYCKKIDSLKTEDAKNRWRDELEMIKCFIEDNMTQVELLLDFHTMIAIEKKKVINTLNRLTDVKAYVIDLSRSEQIEVGHEGYVLSHDGETVKFVDREEFSYNNFSGNILKGWDKSRKRYDQRQETNEL